MFGNPFSGAKTDRRLEALRVRIEQRNLAAIGIGCPPSWTGGNTVTGLRPDSAEVLTRTAGDLVSQS